MARAPIGMGLTGVAQQREEEALRSLGVAAENQARREQENKLRKQQAEAGGMSLGTTLGGAAGYMVGTEIGGTAGGPWGALAGAIVGGLAGKYLF